MMDEQQIADIFKAAFAVDGAEVSDAGIWDHKRVIRVVLTKDGIRHICLYAEGGTLNMGLLTAYADKMARIAKI